MHDDYFERIFESLCEVNSNLEGLRVTITAISQTTNDHESRLRKIEVWRHHLTPILTAITFSLGAILTVALEKLL